MSDQTELRMNLVAIKRVDPYAKDIVNTSAHVAFYTFNTDGNKWEKTDVEGALFIYSRNAEPHHSIFINNRLNTNSLVEPINGQIELQSQPPFLLYRNERSRIRGFWFYNRSECDRIGEIIGRLIKECDNSMKNNNNNVTMNMINNKPQNNNIDIFTMLTKAQEDFNNSSNTPVVKPPQQQQQQQQQQPEVVMKTQSNAVNIVQAVPPTVATPNNVTPQSVMNFFAAAKQPAASEVPLFQRLMSNPVHTVEQIEKQHRASTPTGKITPEVSDLENSFKFMGTKQELGTSPFATFLNSSNLMANRSSGTESKAKPMDVLHIEARQQPLHELLKKSESLNTTLNVSSCSTNTPGKPALMPPTMFQSSSASKAQLNKDKNVVQQQQHQQQQQQQQHLNNNHHPVPEPLTQSQLMQAIEYLIKNDPDFIRKLHEAYLKSFTEMVSQ